MDPDRYQAVTDEFINSLVAGVRRRYLKMGIAIGFVVALGLAVGVAYLFASEPVETDVDVITRKACWLPKQNAEATLFLRWQNQLICFRWY